MAHKDDPPRIVKLEATDVVLLLGVVPYVMNHYEKYENEVIVGVFKRLRDALYRAEEVRPPTRGERLRET